MWIKYQFMAVCPLILNFLNISSQKWLVFANYFGLPNFLPQLANLFTRIYPSYPWHFPSLPFICKNNKKINPYFRNCPNGLSVGFFYKMEYEVSGGFREVCNLLLIVMGKFSSILVFFRPEKAKQVLYVRLHFFLHFEGFGPGFPPSHDIWCVCWISLLYVCYSFAIYTIAATCFILDRGCCVYLKDLPTNLTDAQNVFVIARMRETQKA